MKKKSIKNGTEVQRSGFDSERSIDGANERRRKECSDRSAAANSAESDATPLASPVALFDRYLELIFTNDELWYRFQGYVRSSVPYRGPEYFENQRDPECIEIWRQMLDNMGGGFPITLFASAAFLLLSYRDAGHDLDKELRYAKAKLTRQKKKKELLQSSFQDEGPVVLESAEMNKKKRFQNPAMGRSK